MKWIWPLLIASSWLIIGLIWNLMLGRWKQADWEELVFGFFVCTGVCYLFFFGQRWLGHLGIPIAALVAAILGVALITAFRRKRVSRKIGQ